MPLRSLPRLGLFVLAAVLCLGHADDGGCGGGGDDDDGHHHGSATGATCPPTGAPTAQDFGTAFMQTWCLTCHSATLAGAARREAPVGVDFDTLEDVRRLAELIDSHAAAGPHTTNTDMPPAAQTGPTQQERERLGQWLACGAP